MCRVKITSLRDFMKKKALYSPIFKELKRRVKKNPSPSAELENEHHVKSMGHRLRDMFVDYSKNTVGAQDMALLNKLALESKIEEARDAMFEGQYINKTENRQVLHTAFRSPQNKHVQKSLKKMQSFCNQIIFGQRKGYTGKSITDIVNIGIGGSDLSLRMAVQALVYRRNHLKIHFVSNVDGHDMDILLGKIPLKTTLFIINSKTFTTLETILNAKWAKSWFLDKAPQEAWTKHFIAVTVDTVQAVEFGITRDNIFEFPQSVGGRFSLCSPVGLPVALAIGLENFQALLNGAYIMDRHFQTAEINNNIPIQGAVLSFWYSSLLGFETHGIFPYDQRFDGLVPYLQQLIMESNGKSINQEGEQIFYQTSPIIWGGIGTNVQHTFFQLIHQGVQRVPCDFIMVAKPEHKNQENHYWTLANCLGQTRALSLGKHDHNPFKTFTGQRPSTTIILKELSPLNLGMLFALYEHQVFCLGHLQNIYSFDQWGVELGKSLAKEIYEREKTGQSFDASTNRQLQVLADFS